MPVVKVPPSLRVWFDGKGEIACCGTTVGECIETLDRLFPGVKRRLLDDAGQVSSVFIFINGDNARHLGGLAATVTDQDEIGIIPLAAGG